MVSRRLLALGSPSPSPRVTPSHLAAVPTLHNIRLPHPYILVVWREPWNDGSPPIPPIPPDPPPDPSPSFSFISPRLPILAPRRSEVHHRHLTLLTLSNSPRPSMPPNPPPKPRSPLPLLYFSLSIFTSRSTTPRSAEPNKFFHLIDFSYITATSRSPSTLHQLWLLLISSTSPVHLSRSSLHVSVTSLHRKRLKLLLHVVTSAIFVLLRLQQLRPPVSRARNGNWTVLNPASTTPTNTKGFDAASPTHRFTAFALLAEAFAFKAALNAGPSLEFQHVTVYSDSHSLVSLIIGDVNELKSVLVDIRCLLETFSSISLLYVPRSAIVSADAIAKSALSSLLV